MIDRKAVVQAGRTLRRADGRNDPLLTWLAVHDVVLDVYVTAWRQVQVDGQAAAAEEAERRATEAAEVAAVQRNQVEGAAKAAAEAVLASVGSAMEDATATLVAAVEGAAGRVERAERRARLAAGAAIAFPVATVGALLVWLAA